MRTCRTSASFALARAAADLRRQRLRRDAARARGNGTSSGWPPASSSPGRDNGFSRKDRRRDRRSPRLGQLPARHAGVRRHDQPRRLVRAHRRRGSHGQTVSAQLKAAAAQAHRATAWQGPHHATPCRRCAKLTGVVDGQAADHHRPAADPVPIEDLLPGRCGPGRLRSADRGTCSQATGRRCKPTAGTCSSSSTSVDMARKVVGVGSVGTRCWIILLLGRDEADPLFLQVKEAEPSVLEPLRRAQRLRQPGRAGGRGPAAHAGRQRHLPRLAARQPGSTAASATSTSASCGTGRSPRPSSSMVPARHGGLRPSSAGWTLARAHARSGDRIAIASYLGAPTSSTTPWPSSRRPTPTRTNATTKRS